MAIGEQFPSVLAAARTGAEWAWRAIYTDLAPAVLGYLRARGADSPEDVTGEVFVQVVRDIGRFEGDEAGFRSWIFVMAHHRMLDAKRRDKRRPEYPRPPEDFGDIESVTATEAEALGNVTTIEMRRLLDDLTPDQRDVIALRLLADLSIEEVAAIVGKRPRAVKSLQHRGLETLRRRLEAGS
jgi:RNA polymerase sigma-70 factor (ECF subfamily)